MGLFSALLTLQPAPARGVFWVADQMAEAAEQEQADPAVVRARPAELNKDFEDGLIDEEEFERAEECLLDLLVDRPTGTTGRAAEHRTVRRQLSRRTEVPW